MAAQGLQLRLQLSLPRLQILQGVWERLRPPTAPSAFAATRLRYPAGCGAPSSHAACFAEAPLQAAIVLGTI